MSDNINQLIAQGGVQQNQNPLAMAGNVLDFARGAQSLKTQQFNLQQAQLAPAYQAMRQVMATNPNPTWDDVNAALAQSKRIGGNVDGLVANAAETASKGGNAGDFVRATALGGMSPWEQGQLAGPQRAQFDTGAGTVYGTTGGLWSPQAGKFQPGGFIQGGLSPGQATEFVTVQGPDGKPYQVPRGTLFGTGVPGGSAGGSAGGGGGGPAAGGGGGADLSSLPKPQFLQAVAQRESGGNPAALNYVARADPTAYARGATASGKYQMTNSTWLEGAAQAGVDTSKYPTAMSAPESVQDQVASAVYDHRGTAPWQQQQGGAQWVRGQSGQYTLQPGAPGGAAGGGGGGGPPASGAFIGASSAQPVTGGGGNVQPAGGGMQYFSPTGQPMGQGGGGMQMPGVARTPSGAPVLTPPAPWMGPLWEQSAKEYSTDVSREAGLASRIQPYQSAISIIKANPDLKTGPTSQQWNNWGSTLSQWGVQLPSMPGDSVAAYQELSKALHQGLVQSGAFSGTDMARLEAEASSPNSQQTVEAIRELSARQIGYERFQMARLKQFRSLHPGEDPDQSANQYRSQTSQWASNLDPVAFGADNLTPQEITTYRKGLTPQQDDKFLRSIKEAHRLYPEITPGGQ